MCGRLKINQTIVKPRQVIPSNLTPPGVVVIWGSADDSFPPFAREETLQEKWLSKRNMKTGAPIWETGTLHVDDFAELADHANKEERWYGGGASIKILVRKEGKLWSAVIVTRASTKEELGRYDHGRFPVLVSEKRAS